MVWPFTIERSKSCSISQENFRHYIKKKFFHGFLSDSQSDSKLKFASESSSGNQNYYLVKYSLNFLSEFSLCYTINDGITTKTAQILIHNCDGFLEVRRSPQNLTKGQAVDSSNNPVQKESSGSLVVKDHSKDKEKSSTKSVKIEDVQRFEDWKKLKHTLQKQYDIGQSLPFRQETSRGREPKRKNSYRPF